MGITRAAEGKTGRSFVGDMTEEKSLEMASKLASEGFVFGVSAGGWDRQHASQGRSRLRACSLQG